MSRLIFLYSLIGGIDPSKALSVTLDVGTDNEDLLSDKLYVVSRFSRPAVLLCQCIDQDSGLVTKTCSWRRIRQIRRQVRVFGPRKCVVRDLPIICQVRPACTEVLPA